ncbi:hypothetical protein [Sinomonas sp.]|uniref:hypothetical protein n=1 Tax=Sinomonas sp. TaxID=1914986 RepID=UPI002FE428DB
MNAVAEICGTAPPELVELEDGDELGVLQPASAAMVTAATKALSTPRAETFECFKVIFPGIGRYSGDLAGPAQDGRCGRMQVDAGDRGDSTKFVDRSAAG